MLGNDHEAEDVVQETYLRAFPKLGEFREEASLSTWLTRIAINEALARRRQRRRLVDVAALDTAVREGDRTVMMSPTIQMSDPEVQAARSEIPRSAPASAFVPAPLLRKCGWLQSCLPPRPCGSWTLDFRAVAGRKPGQPE